MKNFEKTLVELAELTDKNDHTGAYILGSNLLNLPSLEKEFIKILEFREMYNGLDYETSSYQYISYKKMMVHAKEQLSDSDYKKFYGCF